MNARNKILFISHDAASTGASRELLLIVKHLDKTKYEPVVVIENDGPLRKQFERYGEVILQGSFGPGSTIIRGIGGLLKSVRLLRRLKPHLLYCNSVMTARWLLSAKFISRPAIIHLHELGYGFEKLSSLERYLLHNYSDICLAASSAVRKYLLTVCALNPGDIVVSPESIEVPDEVEEADNQMRSRLNIEDGTVVVATAGRISHANGTDLFFDIARHLRHHLPAELKVKFLIIGGLPETGGRFNAHLREEIGESDIKDDIIITDSKENAGDYLPAADIFLFPLREEPFPLALLEAMAESKPVAAFSVGAVPEVLSGESGIVVKPLDIEAIQEAVLRLVNNPAERKQMGSNARARVLENFNIARNISRIEDVISTTLADHPSSAGH